MTAAKTQRLAHLQAALAGAQQSVRMSIPGTRYRADCIRRMNESAAAIRRFAAAESRGRLRKPAGYREVK